MIGKEACRVSEVEALNYVEGYTIMHDFSLPEQSYFRPDIKGKCLDSSGIVGPTVVAADSLPGSSKDQVDFNQLSVTTAVNGVPVDEYSIADLIRQPASLIRDITHIMTLQPGAVIAVGFPGKRIALQAGDQVESSISGIGTLSNRVQSNTVLPHASGGQPL